MNKKWLYLVIGCVGLAAQTGKVIAGLPTPDMDERTLQDKYHIASTEEGLTGALQHQEPAVRSFAAVKLAEKGDKAAASPIMAALAVEKVEGVKVIQATSAARLGATEGFNALKSMCEDRTSSPTMRMVAAQSMVNFLGSQECLSDVIDALRSAPDDPEAIVEALNLFPRFKQIPQGQLNEIRDLSAGYLKSQYPAFRILASQGVRHLGGPWAISQLRAALDAEKDENVRKVIAQDLVSVGQ
jgi:hypothetical protein